MSAVGWKIGVEVEALAPRGASRRDLADLVAKDVGGRVRRVFHPQSEPSLVPGTPVFESLTPGFLVERPGGEVVARFLDDLTLIDDLDRHAAPKPGWWRVVGDDARWLRLCARRADPEGELPAALTAFAGLFGTEPAGGPGGTWRIADDAGAAIVLAAPLPGERERPCEIVTAPLSEDHEVKLERLLAPARALGFVAAAEGAVHLHFDGAPFTSARAIARIVAMHAAFGEALRRTVGTNPRCRRLGPHEPALRELVQTPGFTALPWDVARGRLLAVAPSKFVDLNLRNLVLALATKHTLEVRTLPVWMDAAPIVDAMHLFEALFRKYVLGEAEIPAAPVDDLRPVLAGLGLPDRAAARWG